ncbi:cation transporter [Gracilibacillus sp. D59]|uniref:cation transporter n=1 Tax=Gracilibacillus sp. D59 TaxID=3457434 RepID=UPI003FCE8555
MLSDAVSLGVGVLAFAVSERVASYSKTYGYKRFEILAALFNGVTLIAIAIYIFLKLIIVLNLFPNLSAQSLATLPSMNPSSNRTNFLTKVKIFILICQFTHFVQIFLLLK